ncbi:radical SAM protein [Thermoproteota archaeon]
MQAAKEEKKNVTEKLVFHAFKYKGKAYLFDIRTLVSLRIDEAAYEALKLFNDYSKDQILEKLKGRFSESTIQEVFLGIEQLKKQGLFRPAMEETPEEIDAHIKRVVNRESASIQLALVKGCNMRCEYCYEKDCFNKDGNILMSKEVGERAVEFLIEKSKHCKGMNITFFGGEPLINWKTIKHLVHYIEKRAKELGRGSPYYALTTNGTLITKEIARYIKKYNFGLMCSLDGPPEIQNKLRPMAGGKGSFYKAARGIKRVMKIRRQVTVRATTNKANNDCLMLHEFFERFGFTRFAIGAAMGKSFSKGPLDFGPEDVDALIEKADKEIDFALQRLKEGKPLYRNPFTVLKAIHTRKHTKIRCGVGKGTTIVSVDGKLFPCHRYLGMDEYCVGDIWKGYDKQKLYDYLYDYIKIKDTCKPCWLRTLCGGPCPWYVAHEDGHHRSPDEDFQCRIVKSSYERAIWLYEEVKEKYPDYFEKLTSAAEETAKKETKARKYY